MNWSGRNVEKVPVIGELTTIELSVHIGQSVKVWPSETEQVVEILEEPTGKIYILNKWHKPGVPQIRHEQLVKSYTPYPTDNQQVSATH